MTVRTKIQVTEIADNDTIVPVNSGEHRIEEIKQEIQSAFTPEHNLCAVPVWEWGEK
ncbi:MAG TPA: hypothetical protein PK263_04565 [bacterium]|nr:hypothetical protein [bacterium]